MPESTLMKFLDGIDLAYKLLTSLMSIGGLVLMVKIFVQIGEWRQWVKTIDKEVSSHGTMLQQLTSTVNRILGRNEALDKDP